MTNRDKKLIAIIVGILTIIILYIAVIFFEIPIIRDLRNIWIETAMTTADHQWLATSIIPNSVIERVMGDKVNPDNIVVTDIYNNEEIDFDMAGMGKTDEEEYDADEVEALKRAREKERLAKERLAELEKIKEEKVRQSNNLHTKFTGDKDEFGNKIEINDPEQGIVIIEVKGANYKGKLALIDDPSRIFVAHTDRKKERGLQILEYTDKHNAILGINANGFNDPGGRGKGGEIIGNSMASGEMWGTTSSDAYVTMGFDYLDRFVVGRIKDPQEYGLRDSFQYEPLLIADGEVMIKGTAGWGLQPRTVVGQRADGVVAFLVVDGRQPSHSVGITMGQAAELLHQYGVVNAAACDGGSSSVMAYDGKVINKYSTNMKNGRYLPNAVLVKRKGA